jgi:hypothetical protein
MCRAAGTRRDRFGDEPARRLTATIHFYGGDFYGAKRSDWDPKNLLEREYDFALHRLMFEEANAV